MAVFRYTDQIQKPMKKLFSFLWKFQLIRNLTGAAGGALVALVIYQFYTVGSGAVKALLAPPTGLSRSMMQGEVRLSDPTENTADAERLAQRIARQLKITQELSLNPVMPHAAAPALHSLNNDQQYTHNLAGYEHLQTAKNLPARALLPIEKPIEQETFLSPLKPLDPLMEHPAAPENPEMHAAATKDQLPDSGPAALALMAGGASAGYTYMKKRMHRS